METLVLGKKTLAASFVVVGAPVPVGRFSLQALYLPPQVLDLSSDIGGGHGAWGWFLGRQEGRFVGGFARV